MKIECSRLEIINTFNEYVKELKDNGIKIPKSVEKFLFERTHAEKSFDYIVKQRR